MDKPIKEEHKDIDGVELVEARAKEIQFIEDSINHSNKKTMLFQRLPFYKRRRNRNYDKRTAKKFTYRKKDRHFLRTHTFYAKRFFMLQLIKLDRSENKTMFNNISIPLQRRIKSSKYIYKSQDRGFVFDESFRGGFSYDRESLFQEKEWNDSEPYKLSTEVLNSITGTVSEISRKTLLESIDYEKLNQLQNISNLFDVILTESKIYIVGAVVNDVSTVPVPLECVLSIYKKEDYEFYELKEFPNLKIFPMKDRSSIKTHTILCERSQVMDVYQILIKYGIVPICLEEIHRLALENDQMTIFDNVSSKLYGLIEESLNSEVIEKYNRTPKSKRPEMIVEHLYLSKDECIQETGCFRYCIFQITKGTAERGAFIARNGYSVGRVVRSAYKFTNGKCFGLCAMYLEDHITLLERYTIRNIGQFNSYEIELTKILK